MFYSSARLNHLETNPQAAPAEITFIPKRLSAGAGCGSALLNAMANRLINRLKYILIWVFG
jgi:hypothetical protein